MIFSTADLTMKRPTAVNWVRWYRLRSVAKESVLKKAKVYEYRPPKFFNDYLVSGFNNNVLVTRFQPYQGGNGPIQLSNGDPLNGIIRVGTSDLFEDWKFAGGFRISPESEQQ